MPGFDSGVVFGTNIDLSGTSATAGTAQLNTDGQMLIATTAANAGGTHVNVGTLTSPLGTVSIGYSSPNITLDVAGGANPIEKINLQSGTTPCVPSSGSITFNGAVVAAGSIPVQTDGTGANTMALEIQTSQAIAATDATKIGLAAFDSARFTCDANGFVSINGSGIGETITGDSGGALSPTAGNWNVFGASVAAGTSPLVTSGSGSTLTINAQKTQAIASTDATKVGLAVFDSTSFGVDSNGFVTLNSGGFTWIDKSTSFNALKNNGYFITGTCAATLPASPSQGDSIQFAVDGAVTLTITANTGQVIRIGSSVSAAAGTAANNAIGDAVILVYRLSDTSWIATSVIGIWNVT